MILVIITNILAITNAYICYKLVVFKTKGNYVKEYLRFYIVYGFAFAVSLLLFPLFMEVVFPFWQRICQIIMVSLITRLICRNLSLLVSPCLSVILGILRFLFVRKPLQRCCPMEKVESYD